MVYDTHIDRWFEDRGIVANGNPTSQALKTLEEVHELLVALNADNEHEVMDAIGDTYVTLRGVCLTYGVTMQNCVSQAYHEIKDRKGYLNEQGYFIKEEV
jgi:hypothetical protein